MPPDSYWSPYSGLDALCGNPLLIPLDELAEMGLLLKEELPEPQPVELNAGEDAAGWFLSFSIWASCFLELAGMKFIHKHSGARLHLCLRGAAAIPCLPGRCCRGEKVVSQLGLPLLCLPAGLLQTLLL